MAESRQRILSCFPRHSLDENRNSTLNRANLGLEFDGTRVTESQNVA